MTKTLDGTTIAFLATDGVEIVELRKPWAAVVDEGAVPSLVSIDSDRIQGFNGLTPGDEFSVDVSVTEAKPENFDALVLPGGVANPDLLRTEDAAVGFVRAMIESGAPVGVICHGPWTLVNADAVKGRRITSWPSLQVDLENAGADWVDEEVVVDDNGPNVIVSSRKPDDLPAFCKAVVEQFQTP